MEYNKNLSKVIDSIQDEGPSAAAKGESAAAGPVERPRKTRGVMRRSLPWLISICLLAGLVIAGVTLLGAGGIGGKFLPASRAVPAAAVAGQALDTELQALRKKQNQLDAQVSQLAGAVAEIHTILKLMLAQQSTADVAHQDKPMSAAPVDEPKPVILPKDKARGTGVSASQAAAAALPATKATPPAVAPPVTKVTPPVVAPPVTKVTPPAVAPPVTKVTPPVVAPPVTKVTPPVVAPPVTKVTPPVVAPPVAKAVTPVVAPPVQKVTPPVVAPPVTKVSLPDVELPVTKLTPPAGALPATKATLPAVTPPVTKAIPSAVAPPVTKATPLAVAPSLTIDTSPAIAPPLTIATSPVVAPPLTMATAPADPVIVATTVASIAPEPASAAALPAAGSPVSTPQTVAVAQARSAPQQDDAQQGWVINLAYSEKQQTILDLMEKFYKNGLVTEQQKVTINGREGFRLRMTGFASSAEASDYLKNRLDSSLGLKKPWVSRR